MYVLTEVPCATQIMIIVFGQQLPDANAGLAAQLFGVAAASTGLASFALVLALVEQASRSSVFVCLSLRGSVNVMRVLCVLQPPHHGETAPCVALSAVNAGLTSYLCALLQIVLQVIESNVKRGSSVYEQDHVSLSTSALLCCMLFCLSCYPHD